MIDTILNQEEEEKKEETTGGEETPAETTDFLDGEEGETPSEEGGEEKSGSDTE